MPCRSSTLRRSDIFAAQIGHIQPDPHVTRPRYDAPSQAACRSTSTTLDLITRRHFATRSPGINSRAPDCRQYLRTLESSPIRDAHFAYVPRRADGASDELQPESEMPSPEPSDASAVASSPQRPASPSQ